MAEVRNIEFTLGKRFKQAVGMACDYHRTQKRKNLNTPYMTHLLGVTALVCENIGLIAELQDDDLEDYAITAMLHDVVEDEGGEKSRAEIERTFGKKIADYVMMLSDSSPAEGEKKPPKEVRNKIYKNQLKKAPVGVVLISCCDKVHNLRSIAADSLLFGAAIAKSYSLAPEPTIENYCDLEKIYRSKLGDHRILKLYETAVGEAAAALGVEIDPIRKKLHI